MTLLFPGKKKVFDQKKRQIALDIWSDKIIYQTNKKPEQMISSYYSEVINKSDSPNTSDVVKLKCPHCTLDVWSNKIIYQPDKKLEQVISSYHSGVCHSCGKHYMIPKTK